MGSSMEEGACAVRESGSFGEDCEAGSGLDLAVDASGNNPVHPYTSRRLTCGRPSQKNSLL